MGFSIQITWRGSTTTVFLDAIDPTLERLGRALEKELGASFETVKLLVPGKKGQVAPFQNPEQLLSEAGLVTGCKALLVASRAEDVTQVRASRELSGIRGFEDELRRAARRRRTTSSITDPQPPRAEFTFGSYEAWQRPLLHPPPGEALKLLYRLAGDFGILGVMEAHRYRVGLLSEMPPEGKVGISPVCVLGVNINGGQEISLRLRTDDLKGFRKYERIRETLIHELAHMEFGEHDNNFKQLNSLLAHECGAINSRYSGGRSLLDDAGPAGDGDMRPSELDAAWLRQDDVMAVTARLSGRTLRQLASTSSDSSVAAVTNRGGAVPLVAPPVRAAAASAAVLRHRVQQGPDTSSLPQPGLAPGAVRVGRNVGGETESNRRRDAADSGDSASDEAGDGGGGDGVRKFEHFDAATEQAELAARRLGSLDEQQQGIGGNGGGQGGGGKELGTDAVGAAMDDPMDVHPQGDAANLVEGRATTHELLPAAARPAMVSPSLPEELPPVADVPMGQEPSGADARPLRNHSEKEPTAAVLSSSATGPGATVATVDAAATPANPAPPAPPPRLVLQPPPGLMDGAGGGVAADSSTDVVQAKVRQAWSALACLVAASSRAGGAPESGPTASPSASGAAALSTVTVEDVATALDTLGTMLGNAAHLPSEDRYRRVRLGNGAFHRRVGRLPGGLELLRIAGFTEEGTGAEAALRLRRNDPGLLWLVLSAVREAGEQVKAQLAAAGRAAREVE